MFNFSVIATFIACLFLVPGAWLIWDTQAFLARAERVDGVVVGKSRISSRSSRDGGSGGGNVASDYAVCAFTTRTGQAVEFTSDHGYVGIVWKFPYEIGESVRIAYDPENPEHAKILRYGELWFVPTTIMVFAIPTLLLGLSGPVGRARRALAGAGLERRGVTVTAQVRDIVKNPFQAENGVAPWVVMAEWQDPQTSKTWRFLSGPLWQDPTPQLKAGTVQVLIDPRDPGRHRMELPAA